MAPPQKGKQATKGAKQIVEENVDTLTFYRNMVLIASTIYLILTLILFEFTTVTIIMSIISIAIHAGAYQFMAFMCRSKLSETGAILDAGTDLNMIGGISEHVKDLIILTSITQISSLLSNWFWFLLLLIPIRTIMKLWGSIIQPWMNQKTEEPEIDEKKQRKLDKKMKRMK